MLLAVSVCGIAASQSSPILPKVFMIGEFQEQYDQITGNHDDLLSAVCSNSLDVAYESWSDLLNKLEQHAISKGYDIKGIKLWINVFWTPDGRIEYIAFYPKPISKNTNYDEFAKILNSFIPTYTSSMKHSKSYSHYGSASFPTHSIKAGKS